MTGPSLLCLEGNSLECSIRLSATHHPLCSDLHPSLPDGVHGPYLINFWRNAGHDSLKKFPVGTFAGYLFHVEFISQTKAIHELVFAKIEMVFWKQ